MASNAVRRRRRAKRRLMYPPLNRLFSREELDLVLAGSSPYLQPGEWKSNSNHEALAQGKDGASIAPACSLG